MKMIKYFMTIISCTLVFLAVTSTTVTAAIADVHMSTNAGRIGMASSASNRMHSSSSSCDNGGCIGMASSSGLI